jgi:hypothetical protein
MSTETEATNVSALEVVKPELLQVSRAPEVVLEEARRAAAALQKVINGKTKKIILNNEQYLEYEDWETLGRFYGVTARVEWSRPVEFGDAKGFEARATAISTTTGQELSAADAMCLNDESNWRGKPLFQLRSMAQTRACAKALRNVLGWVSVLAGYKATPFEELDGLVTPKSSATPQVVKPAEQQEFIGGPVVLVEAKAISYTRKTGKDAGKAAEFFAVTFRDAAGTELEAATFDTKLFELAKELSGRRVLLSYKPGKRPGKFELVSLEPERTEVEELEP